MRFRIRTELNRHWSSARRSCWCAEPNTLRILRLHRKDESWIRDHIDLRWRRHAAHVVRIPRLSGHGDLSHDCAFPQRMESRMRRDGSEVVQYRLLHSSKRSSRRRQNRLEGYEWRQWKWKLRRGRQNYRVDEVCTRQGSRRHSERQCRVQK